VTGSRNLFGDGLAIAEQLRQTVKNEIGVTISIGVSFNKMFAKMGSDYKKPDAITVISKENFKQIVYPLPVRAMMYVGPRTASALENCNIRTIGALAAASPSFLISRFGKMGEVLHAYANGLDDSPVLSRAERAAPKSVGNGMTFRHDLVSAEELRAALGFLSEEVAARLRAADRRATTVSVAIKDTMLQTLSRQMPLDAPTNLARELADAAMRLTRRAWNIGRPVRALTVTAMNLIATDEGGEQIGFFDAEKDRRREKTTRIEDAMDRIRERYGKASIASGATISSDFGISPVKKSSSVGKETKKEEKNT
jgi:DNA polymerase-4